MAAPPNPIYPGQGACIAGGEKWCVGPKGAGGTRSSGPHLEDTELATPQLYLVCSHSGSLSLQGQGEGRN